MKTIEENTQKIVREKKAREGFLKTKKRKIIFGIVLILVISLILGFAQGFNTASISLTAHFSAVTNGENPDGTPFNIQEILCDEVLQNATHKLDADINILSLKKHLTVLDNTNQTDQDVLKENIRDGVSNYSYFPSDYRLTFSTVSDEIANDGFFASVKAVINHITLPSKKKILNAVAESYIEYYDKKYIHNGKALNVEWEKIDSLDYYNKAESVGLALNKLSTYMYEKYENDIDFVSASKGIGYGDLHGQLMQILNVDVQNYKSFITTHGLSYNRAALLRQFRYMRAKSDETYQRELSKYNITKNAISFYDANASKVVFIPSLDSENSFYMNRTKVGMDYLVENANAAKINADEAKADSSDYLYLENHFSGMAEAAPEIYAQADAMYNEIKGKIETLTATAHEVIKENSDVEKYENMEIGKAGGSFAPLSILLRSGKIFIILLLLSYLGYNLFEYIKNTYKKIETGGEN